MQWYPRKMSVQFRTIQGIQRHTQTPGSADCKSVAKASQVRILYLPPTGQRVFLATTTDLSWRPVRSQSAVADRVAAASNALATASRSSGNRCP
jgi:hypothetical protein